MLLAIYSHRYWWFWSDIWNGRLPGRIRLALPWCWCTLHRLWWLRCQNCRPSRSREGSYQRLIRCRSCHVSLCSKSILFLLLLQLRYSLFWLLLSFFRSILCSGAMIAPMLFNNYGRKLTMQVASVVFSIGAACQGGAVNSNMLAYTRLLSGGGIGMLSMCAPVYMWVLDRVYVLLAWFISRTDDITTSAHSLVENFRLSSVVDSWIPSGNFQSPPASFSSVSWISGCRIGTRDGAFLTLATFSSQWSWALCS